jgi:tetratricopeptide (TPR) repeat protein
VVTPPVAPPVVTPPVVTPPVVTPPVVTPPVVAELPDAGLAVVAVEEVPPVGEEVPPVATEAVGTDPAEVAEAPEDPEDAAATADERAERVRRLIREANYARSHGDAEAAEAGYLHVLRLDRANARALAGMVRLYQSRSEPRTALFWARRLTTLHPEMPANHVLLGDILEATGDHSGARAAWERALSVSPGYDAAERRLGTGG